jgi:hypothetical protein
MSRGATRHPAIFVFTPHGLNRILADGGSQPWALNLSRARQCEYLVLAQNRGARGEGPRAPHGTAFLVGRIADILPSPEEPDRKPPRWLIAIDAYAPVDIPEAWPGARNPVNYSALEDIGIDLEELEFRPLQPEHETASAAPAETTVPLTIEQAKCALAAHYNVQPGQIEIVIRG